MQDDLYARLLPYIGRTVTVFTASGGISGSGFTGVLAGLTPSTIRLITDIGAPPACPVWSTCMGDKGQGFGGQGFGSENFGGFPGGYNWLGSITEIPIFRIVSFVHNAI